MEIGARDLELLEFDKIKSLIGEKCSSTAARDNCARFFPSGDAAAVLPQLHRLNELKSLLQGNAYFPSVSHDDIMKELQVLSVPDASLEERSLLKVKKAVEVANTMIRFLHGKRAVLPHLYGLAELCRPVLSVIDDIDKVIDAGGDVRSSASPELQRIRNTVVEKHRESDRRFYGYVSQLRKLGYLRENEEGFSNGRRTLAVIADFKAEVAGFVHDKSESGKTIFIEPGTTIAVNNEIAELAIDERREIHRLLRDLCARLFPLTTDLVSGQDLLVEVDLCKACVLFAIEIKASMPAIGTGYQLDLREAFHPLLFLQNRRTAKTTVPVNLTLNETARLLVISGPNAGGKTVALKTVALLQIMLQSGLLVPASESSVFSFYRNILIDIGDTQSIENELSTYSAKLKSMTRIIDSASESSLVLMDEFGSGTDPELGGAIAEAVLESLAGSGTKGIVTSHFGNVKVLAGTLQGCMNASMLFNGETFEPEYVLSIGEPGSSYTFEVAERIGFPKRLIERAKQKVNREKLRLNNLLAEVQGQKAKLGDALQRAELEQASGIAMREKYQALFDDWQQKIGKERERKMELARLAEYGRKYLRLMDDWKNKMVRRDVVRRFIDGITAETKRQEAMRKTDKKDAFAKKKIALIKHSIRIGSRVKVLNGMETGVVEKIRDEKVQVKFGALKMTVGMENLSLADQG